MSTDSAQPCRRGIGSPLGADLLAFESEIVRGQLPLQVQIGQPLGLVVVDGIEQPRRCDHALDSTLQAATRVPFGLLLVVLAVGGNLLQKALKTLLWGFRHHHATLAGSRPVPSQIGSGPGPETVRLRRVPRNRCVFPGEKERTTGPVSTAKENCDRALS